MSYDVHVLTVAAGCEITGGAPYDPVGLTSQWTVQNKIKNNNE